MILDTIYGNQKENKRPLLTGLKIFNRFTNGIRSGYFVIAGEPKSGKTSVVNYLFLLSIYLENPDRNVKWVYYSFEIGLIEMQARFISFFIDYFYDEALDPEYILGRMLSEDQKSVLKITEEHLMLIEQVYYDHIVILFGGLNRIGKEVEGKIIFFEEKTNPTGVYRQMLALLSKHGVIHEKKVEVIDTVEGVKTKKEVKVFDRYEKKDDCEIILICDHMRFILPERGFDKKMKVDKLSEYFAEFQKNFGVIVAAVIHFNRGITDLDRIKYNKERLHGLAEDLKDSGNPAEDCTGFITIFSPKDDKYKLSSHFGVDISKMSNKSYRTLHIVYLRDRPCPNHMSINVNGKTGVVNQIQELF